MQGLEFRVWKRVDSGCLTSGATNFPFQVHVSHGTQFSPNMDPCRPTHAVMDAMLTLSPLPQTLNRGPYLLDSPPVIGIEMSKSGVPFWGPRNRVIVFWGSILGSP